MCAIQVTRRKQTDKAADVEPGSDRDLSSPVATNRKKEKSKFCSVAASFFVVVCLDYSLNLKMKFVPAKRQ
jgi:hypothetical protein